MKLSQTINKASRVVNNLKYWQGSESHNPFNLSNIGLKQSKQPFMVNDFSEYKNVDFVVNKQNIALTQIKI